MKDDVNTGLIFTPAPESETAGNQIDPVLVERFAHGNGTVFVGAGISLGARLPSWAKLMEPLRNDLRNEVSAGASYLDIAELYETKHSRGVLIQYLKDRLGDVRFQLTQTHELIVSLPVQRIYTTNFDNLLEQAARKRQINRNVIVNASHIGLSDTSTLSIVKLHGDLEDADSLVISARDYHSYFDRNPAVADLLKVELQTHTVLFLGYSFSDPNFGMILGKVAAQSGSVRPLLYSLQLRPKPLAVQALRARGVNVIAINAAPGSSEADEAIESWLRCFRKALIRYDRRKTSGPPAMDGMRCRFPAPQFPHTNFHANARRRIEAGLQSDFRVLVVKGEAGVGKTMLVAEAIADYVQSTGVISISDAFEQVIWVACDDQQTTGHNVLEHILDTIAIALDAFAITEAHDVPSSDAGRRQRTERDREEQDREKYSSELRLKSKRARVNQLLQEHKVIVVLEDLKPDAADVKAWLENAGPYANPKSRVVVTSRDAVVTGFVVEVDRLNQKDAVKMVRECAGAMMLRRKMKDGIDHLAVDLGYETRGNPQAIRMAVGLINGTGKVDAANIKSDPDFQPTGTKNIEQLFSLYAKRAWEHLDVDARAILSAMLAFPAMVAVPSRLLRKAAGLNDSDFRKGVTTAGAFGLLERDVANDTFNIHQIPRDCMRRCIDQIGHLEAAERRLAEHILGFLSDKNVLCRSEIEDPYWNTLVRAEMAKVDPYWPIISHVMRRAVVKGNVAQFVVLLAHYMDSRFLNAERLEFLRYALVELEDAKKPLMEATLRIDALAWTYLEEGLLKEAQAEIATGLRLLDSLCEEPAHELRALAHAWTARLKCGNSHKLVEAMDSIKEAREHAQEVDTKYWISMRVEMIEGDVQMMQHNAKCAKKHYEEAECLMQRYGGEGNNYQTAPRMGFALLALEEDAEAERLFRMLADNVVVPTGRLYGEYGLALIAARGQATQDAVRHLRTIHRDIAQRGSGNVLMVLANLLYQRILTSSPAVG